MVTLQSKLIVLLCKYEKGDVMNECYKIIGGFDLITVLGSNI